jgi:hypothetical protein
MSAVDIPQIIHMCFSGIMGLAALYFKMVNGKLETRVAVLEERSRNEQDRLDNLESRRRE